MPQKSIFDLFGEKSPARGVTVKSTFEAIPSLFLCLDRNVSVTTRFVILQLVFKYHARPEKISNGGALEQMRF